MNCENCCEAFVGTYEGFYVYKDDKKMRVCSCCKNEYIMMGWIGIKVEEPDDDEEGGSSNCDCYDDEDEGSTTNEYMEEDMGECPKCDCAVKRKDLAWRIGYYLDICSKCDDDE